MSKIEMPDWAVAQLRTALEVVQVVDDGGPYSTKEEELLSEHIGWRRGMDHVDMNEAMRSLVNCALIETEEFCG